MVVTGWHHLIWNPSPATPKASGEGGSLLSASCASTAGRCKAVRSFSVKRAMCSVGLPREEQPRMANPGGGLRLRSRTDWEFFSCAASATPCSPGTAWKAALGTFDTATFASAELSGASRFLSFDVHARPWPAPKAWGSFPRLSPPAKAHRATQTLNEDLFPNEGHANSQAPGYMLNKLC